MTTTIDLTQTTYNLTEKEQNTMKVHFDIAEKNCGLYGIELLDDNCSCATLQELVAGTDYNTRQMKGIIGSLIKKKVIWLDDRSGTYNPTNTPLPWIYYIYGDFIESLA